MPKHRRRHPRPLKVKKVQRSFTVEYRSGRRKLNSNPSSIWGDMDLKSVAEDLQDEASPFLTPMSQAGSSEKALTGEEQSSALLTLPMAQETNVSALQEIRMADENNTMTVADTPAVATPDVPKKERKPRVKRRPLKRSQPQFLLNRRRLRMPQRSSRRGDASPTRLRQAPNVRLSNALRKPCRQRPHRRWRQLTSLRIFSSWKRKTKDCASCSPKSCVLKTPICESGSTSLDR